MNGASAAGEAIGLDVGGTKIAGFRVAADGTVLDRVVESTPADAERIAEAMERVAGRLTTPDVVALGAGVASMIDASTGVARYGPNLPFREFPLRERLAAATGLPCMLDNDAAVAAWGEYRCGAGRGADMLLVTVGTGIGGAIVSGGRLFRGAHGFAAEIGHVIVEPGGPRCGCGNLGCWEQVASGHAIGRLAREAAARNPGSLMVELAGGDPDRIRGPVVDEAARRGDATAVGILAEVGRRLGEGIAGLVNILDPEVVVVGGGAVSAGDLLLSPAREAFRSTVEAARHRPEVPIVPAALGNDAGGIGAALLALEEPAPGGSG